MTRYCKMVEEGIGSFFFSKYNVPAAAMNHHEARPSHYKDVHLQERKQKSLMITPVLHHLTCSLIQGLALGVAVSYIMSAVEFQKSPGGFFCALSCIREGMPRDGRCERADRHCGIRMDSFVGRTDFGTID